MAQAGVEPIAVEITEWDIEHGEVAHCGKCPVALALRRMYPDADLIEVAEPVVVGDEEFTPGDDMLAFIGRFDNYEHVTAETVHMFGPYS
jgi:hypothetical protein